jgi:NADH-quinone oxidoreductase subunit C
MLNLSDKKPGIRTMEKDRLMREIAVLMPQVEVVDGKQYPEVMVNPGHLHELAAELKNNSLLAFDYLFSQTGVDLPEGFMIVCHLESTALGHALVVKVKTGGRENPVVDSVSDIWAAAEFYEREIYDLMGVRFNNHPDLRRLFLDDSWGFPLRKDYRDEINIIER